MASDPPPPSTLREAHGRLFNSEISKYTLPADQPEFARLDKQHEMHKLSLGSLYAANNLVRQALAPKEGQHKAVADLGSGSGIWAIEVALEYPHAEVVGIDITPNMARPAPPNCRFERGDMTNCLAGYANHFDVVHIRSATVAVGNPTKLLNDIARILKPGGILLFVDGELGLLGEDGKPALQVAEGHPGHSYMVTMLAEAAKAMQARGSNILAGHQQRGWMEANGSFKNIGTRTVCNPVGPWFSEDSEQGRRMNAVGVITRENALGFIRSLRPLLISSGIREATVDYQIAKTDEELSGLHVHLYTQWHYCWGQKQ